MNGVASGTAVNNTGTWNLGTDSIWIGSIEAPFAGKAFYGSIDEVRFWTEPRNATQIRTNRYVGIGDGGAANANNALTSSSAYGGLVASWTFNTGSTTQYDDIGGHHGYRRSGATSYASGQGLPIPYNLALYCPGDAADYVSIQHSTAFSQTFSGSMEAWVKPTVSGLNTIFQKGTTFATTTLAFYISAGNKVGINIGAHNYISGGATIPMGRWTHVAATWTGGPSFTVRLYVNGELDDTQTHTLAMPTNSDTAWIGRYYTTTGNFTGYIDEVRLWSDLRTQAEIRQNMFVSGRALLPNSSLAGLWNFHGNLNNFSANSGLNGSFANVTGGGSNARLSGNVGESDGFAHTTVINRTGDPNPFPGGYTIRTPFKKIPDSNTAGVLDTIAYPTATGVSAVEVFLSVQHTYVGDLVVTLTAPNGQTRNLLNRHGGTRENILTFFNDGFGEDGSSTVYRAPWAYLKPIEAMGNFGGTPAQGNWVLKVSDNAGADTGWVQGWGLRFNNATGIAPISGEIPKEFTLLQNYPNPFNPSTAIEFSLPEQSAVTIRIFNVLGQRVAVLADNEEQQAGTHRVTWSPAAAGGLGSGVYFYRIEAKSVTGRAFAETRKMLFLK